MTDTSVATVWTVGSNIARYLPDGDVRTFDTFTDAQQALIDLLTDSVETAYQDENCECPEEDELCELCSYDALIEAICQEVRTLPPHLPYTAYARPEYQPLPTAYWIQDHQEVTPPR